MPFAPVCFWAIQTRVTFWAIFETFFLVLPLHFLRKWGFRVTLQKLPYLCHSGTFGAAFWAKIFSSLCTLSADQLRDNAICARVLLGLSNEGYFQGDFLKFPLVPPLHFLRKCGFRVTLRNLPYLSNSGTFGAAFCAKIFSSLCS